MKKKFITLLAITLMAFGNTAFAEGASSAIFTAVLDLTTVKETDAEITSTYGIAYKYTKKFGTNDALTLYITTDPNDGLNFGTSDDSDYNDGLSIYSGSISIVPNSTNFIIQSVKYTFFKEEVDGNLVDESPADLTDAQYKRPATIIDNGDGTATYTYNIGTTDVTMEFSDLDTHWIGLKKIEVEYTTNGTFNFIDQTNYYNTKDTEGELTFNYIRKYYGCWQSLYVPFSINIEDISADYEIATISNITADGMYISKMTSGSTEPNKFYLINKKSVSDAVNGEQAVINLTSEFAAAAETTATYDDGYTVTGTYTTYDDCVGRSKDKNPYTIYVDPSTNKSVLERPDGSSNCAIPAQRWYVSGDFSSSNSKVAIFVIGEDDTPTTINNLEVKNAVDSYSYNLAGQRVMSDTKGLIIKNGKKFYNK